MREKAVKKKQESAESYRLKGVCLCLCVSSFVCVCEYVFSVCFFV